MTGISKGIVIIAVLLIIWWLWDTPDPAGAESASSDNPLSAPPGENEVQQDSNQQNPFALRPASDKSKTAVKVPVQPAAAVNPEADKQAIASFDKPDPDKERDQSDLSVKTEREAEYYNEQAWEERGQTREINMDASQRHWPEAITELVGEHFNNQLPHGRAINNILTSEGQRHQEKEARIQAYMDQIAVTYGIDIHSIICRKQDCMLTVLQQQPFFLDDYNSWLELGWDIAGRFGLQNGVSFGSLPNGSEHGIHVWFFEIK